MTLHRKIFLRYLILLFLILLKAESINSQVIEEWLQRYNGNSNLSDGAKSIMLDNMGNFLVIGSSDNSGTSSEYVVLKYNQTGMLLWVAKYSGFPNRDNQINAIAIDDSNNVIVTGSSEGINTGYDFATVKYNSSGIQKWVTRYSRAGNHRDAAYAISLDRLGNVYVTGQSFETQTNEDIATIKYNSSGVQQWVARYDGNTHTFDKPESITVDNLNNIYITGESDGDFCTIKYNSSGVQQWVENYDGIVSGNDFGHVVRVDNIGNVYVSGTSTGSMQYFDYATVKYDSSGKELWVRRYEGSAHFMDNVQAMTIDGIGNVYLTGNGTETGQGYNFTTIKYDTYGNQRWIAQYDHGLNDIAFSLDIDNSGNVYVTGESDGNGTGDDYATVKYDSNGIQKWSRRFSTTGDSSDVAISLVVDISGSVFVTGSSNRDILTIKYSQLTGVNPISLENPSIFKLEQNYPNPFNPVTNINFSLPNNKFVILMIYDILGNEVNRIINERKNAGTYSVQFNGNYLPSGIYFYSLFLDGKAADTKRMVLLK